MSSHSTICFQDVLTSCQLDSSDSLLDGKTIRRAFADAECEFGYPENTVFDRNTTLWAFLREMLHTGTQRTLQTAVHGVQQLRIAKGLDPNSANTGTYAAARAKIDVKVPLSLLNTIARNAENAVAKTMTLRLVRVRIDMPGSRTQGFFVVTNLMDAVKYPFK